MIGTKRPYNIDQEIIETSMSCMLKFTDVFKFIIYTFYNGSFSEKIFF